MLKCILNGMKCVAAIQLGVVSVILAVLCSRISHAEPPRWVQQAHQGYARRIEKSMQAILEEMNQWWLPQDDSLDPLEPQVDGQPPLANPDTDPDSLKKTQSDAAKALRAYATSQWNAAAQGPGAKYFDMLGDLDAVVERIRTPVLVEPPDPILVDPLGIAAADMEPVYYVNGMWTPREKALDEARTLALRSQRPVWLIHNPTSTEQLDLKADDYLSLLGHLVFFGIPVPDALVDATFAEEEMVTLKGLGDVSLADLHECQWDMLWYEWMRKAPQVELLGKSRTVFPHQPNATTRQLTYILMTADRPLTVVTHSQGGLIFRNAALIAAALGRADWVKDNVSWQSVGSLFSATNDLPIPGWKKAQILQTPDDPLVALLSDMAGALAQGTAGGGLSNLGNGPLEQINFPPLSFPVVLGTIPPPPPPPAIPFKYVKHLEFTNNTSERVRVHFQYARWSNDKGDYLWTPNTTLTSNWNMQELKSNETLMIKQGGSPIEAARVRLWIEGEFGFWIKDNLSTELELIDPDVNGMRQYINNAVLTYSYPIDYPSAAQKYDAKLVEVTNIQIATPITTANADVESIDIPGEVIKQTAVPKPVAFGITELLRDSSDWPLRYGTKYSVTTDTPISVNNAANAGEGSYSNSNRMKTKTFTN